MNDALASSAIACLMTVLSVAPAAAQGDQLLPVTGGGGGNPFQARCPADQHLLGFNLRAGHDLDAIQPVCGVPQSATNVPPTTALQSFGGGGGQPARIMCPANSPVVLGLDVFAEGIGLVVNSVSLYCGAVVAQQARPNNPGAIFSAPKQPMTHPDRVRAHLTYCPPGLLGVGVHGRSGAMVDALGLICGPPQTGFTETAARTLNKRKLPEAVRVARANYDRYVGKYAIGPTHIVTITRVGSQLFAEEFINGNSFARRELLQQAESSFVSGDSEMKVRFETDFSGRAAALMYQHKSANEIRAVRVAN